MALKEIYPRHHKFWLSVEFLRLYLQKTLKQQAEILLHGLERAAAGISLHANAPKTECMCFNQSADISTINGSSLKLMDKFTYLGSSVSSSETGVNTRLAKAWTAIDRLSVIWKSDLTDKIEHIFPSCGRIDTAIWMHYIDANKTYGERAWRQLHKNAASNIKQVPKTKLHKPAAIWLPNTHHKNYPSKINQTCVTLTEK